MNDATKLIANEAKSIVQAHLDRLGEPKEHQISAQAKQEKFAQIQAELEKQNAVLVAHYYCDPEIQELAGTDWWLCLRFIGNGTFWT
jgi:Quinolinate synthase